MGTRSIHFLQRCGILSLTFIAISPDLVNSFLRVPQKSSPLDVRFNGQNVLNLISTETPPSTALGTLTALPSHRIEPSRYIVKTERGR